MEAGHGSIRATQISRAGVPPMTTRGAESSSRLRVGWIVLLGFRVGWNGYMVFHQKTIRLSSSGQGGRGKEDTVRD